MMELSVLGMVFARWGFSFAESVAKAAARVFGPCHRMA
jgi:hypothetical protein